MSSWEIQSLIDETEEELRLSRARQESLQDDLREVRDIISSLEGELRVAINETTEEKRSVERLIALSKTNKSNIRGPGWASAGAQDIETGFDEATNFAYTQLSRLDSALGRENMGERSAFREVLNNIVSIPEQFLGIQISGHPSSPSEPYEAHPDTWGSVEVVPLLTEVPKDEVIKGAAPTSVLKYAGGNLLSARTLQLVDLSLVLDTSYEYEVGDKIGAIPYRVYTINREGWGDGDRTAERLGEDVSASMLAAEGRRAIVLLGGPGKPDILSLDANGMVWMTEVKGSFRGTSLSRSGLLRSVNSDITDPLAAPSDPLGGKLKVWENSPEWLRRSGADVLRNLMAMESKAEDPAVRAGIRELAQRYAEAVSAGFEQSNHATEIFQIGSLPDGDSLPYLEPNPTLHAYCAEVEPARITQVTTE